MDVQTQSLWAMEPREILRLRLTSTLDDKNMLNLSKMLINRG